MIISQLIILFIASSLFELAVSTHIMKDYIVRYMKREFNKGRAKTEITEKDLTFAVGWMLFFSFCFFRIFFAI